MSLMTTNLKLNTINIANKKIGPGYPCMIIAEAGVNHNGRLDMACQLIDVAVEAGADAVKFQTFRAERLLISGAPKADYQIKATSRNESQYEMLESLELSPEIHQELMSYCLHKDILFMSSPFDKESADLLKKLNVAAYKIPSGEITNLSLLNHVARKGLPMIISTGMASLTEVKEAVKVVKACGNEEILLLHCVSNYPTNPVDANLLAIKTMTQELSVPVGYSDHTMGSEVSLAAVALGACVIEKHFTLDRSQHGPDHHISLEPDELAGLVRSIRVVESALGHGRKEPALVEEEVAAVARRSLVAAKEISAGSAVTEDMISFRRPGTGLPPSMCNNLIGKIVRQDVKIGTLFTLEMFK